jgi:TRAF-type zinc finger.
MYPPPPSDQNRLISQHITCLCPQVSDSEKDTMGSLIHCIHYKEGCKWYDELKSLKGHLQTCKYDAIPCNKCLAAIPKTLMEDHSKFTCPERITTCQYCLESFSGILFISFHYFNIFNTIFQCGG